jgi:catechol 2,3-dioxygenase-like lactoylglutathione lyase family enzyme
MERITMVESISAVTLATHNMPRAVRFYRVLGFEIVHGDDNAALERVFEAPVRHPASRAEIRVESPFHPVRLRVLYNGR